MASTVKERVIKDLRSIKGEKLHYFTTVIIGAGPGDPEGEVCCQTLYR